MQKNINAEVRLFSAWLRSIGVSDTTGWRWRQRGILETVNICGKCYITAETIAEFKTRALRGDFAQRATGAARRSAEARTAKGE